MIPFDFSKVFSVLPKLLPYLPVTLGITGVTIIVGTLLGGFFAKESLKEDSIAKKLVDGYILFMRCTPPIVLIFLIFYGLPKLLLSLFLIDINTWYKGIFVVISLTLLFAANIAVTFKSAYLAVPYAQTEAGLAAGLTEFQVFARIIVPQAAKVALPNYANNVLTLLKEGSLAYTIGLIDIMGQAQNIIARNLGNFALETYVAVTLIYWGLAIIIEQFARIVERTWSKGTRGFTGGES
ncbi:MAG: amino acid ABC transporter permease [Lactobacillales bacterium]|nr:amino acid ABC transporter permease [Lactobacillales bacterium]